MPSSTLVLSPSKLDSVLEGQEVGRIVRREALATHVNPRSPRSSLCPCIEREDAQRPRTSRRQRLEEERWLLVGILDVHEDGRSLHRRRRLQEASSDYRCMYTDAKSIFDSRAYPSQPWR